MDRKRREVGLLKLRFEDLALHGTERRDADLDGVREIVGFFARVEQDHVDRARDRARDADRRVARHAAVDVAANRPGLAGKLDGVEHEGDRGGREERAVEQFVGGLTHDDVRPDRQAERGEDIVGRRGHPGGEAIEVLGLLQV